MGISILSGAITTIGASFFMLYAQIEINVKFGFALTTTIAMSFAISMIFFGSLMHIFGPVGLMCELKAIPLLLKRNQ